MMYLASRACGGLRWFYFFVRWAGSLLRVLCVYILVLRPFQGWGRQSKGNILSINEKKELRMET